MTVNIKLSTKHLHKFLYKTKNVFPKMFSKNLIHSQKALLEQCMQILNLLTIQHHTTAKDKFIHVLQEQYTRQKEQHSIITQFQTVSVHCFD